MPPAARMTDMHVCPMVTGVVPHVGGPILPPCCPTVLIGMLPAARITDLATCVGPPDVIVKGSPTVLIANLMAARVGDITAHGGNIILGCFTVMIGDVGSGAPPSPVALMPPASATGPFNSQEQAARAALGWSNSQSIRDNREYAGLIYRGTDGKYYFSGPVVGSDQGANPHSAPAPAGAQVVGDYHTHADYSTANPTTGAAVRTSDPTHDDFNSDNFSATDKTGIASDGAGTPGYEGYLGTPSGTFRRYDPATGSDTAF